MFINLVRPSAHNNLSHNNERNERGDKNKSPTYGTSLLKIDCLVEKWRRRSCCLTFASFQFKGNRMNWYASDIIQYFECNTSSNWQQTTCSVCCTERVRRRWWTRPEDKMLYIVEPSFGKIFSSFELLSEKTRIAAGDVFGNGGVEGRRCCRLF